MYPPFDRLRANGFDSEIIKDFPFVLSLSKHERRLFGTSHLGKLYMCSDASTYLGCVLDAAIPVPAVMVGRCLCHQKTPLGE